MTRYPRTAALLQWYGKKVMLSQRLKGDFAGYWTGIGGKLEEGESIVEGLVREIKEEAGIYIPYWEMELLDCITDHPSTDKLFLFRRGTYELNFYNVKHMEPKKHSPWQLFTVAQVKKLKIMPGLIGYIKPTDVFF